MTKLRERMSSGSRLRARRRTDEILVGEILQEEFAHLEGAALRVVLKDDHIEVSAPGADREPAFEAFKTAVDRVVLEVPTAPYLVWI
jgi:hypothetical protein